MTVSGFRAQALAPHVAAFIAISVWGTTYVSSKILLGSFSPLEITAVRFAVGAALLALLSPPQPSRFSVKKELPFALAGFLGIFLYFFLENLATKHTEASNVSIIVTTIPFLTACVSALFGTGRINPGRFALSTAASMGGVTAVILGGAGGPRFSPKGDVLALGAAGVFALYTVVLKRTGASGLVAARKTVLWGLACILPAAALSGNLPDPREIFQRPFVWHFLFLGLMPSGVCFALWSSAVSALGAIRTSSYIYFVPVITSAVSFFALGEPITAPKIAGFALIAFGAALNSGN